MTDVNELMRKAFSAVQQKLEDDNSSDDETPARMEVDTAAPRNKNSNKKGLTQTNSAVQLSCSLQHGIADPTGGLCVDGEGNARMAPSYLQSLNEADSRCSTGKSCAELAKPTPGVRQGKKEWREERAKTKGRDWFNLPAPVMTEELKNDLRVLQMRKALDPKRFYKGPDIRGALPKYFQMGRVVEAPEDFYSARVPRKQRKATLVDELLADVNFRRYNKKKYEEIQARQPRTFSRAYKHMKRLKKNKK